MAVTYCKNHKRYTAGCVECQYRQNEYRRNWSEENKDKIREYNRRYIERCGGKENYRKRYNKWRREWHKNLPRNTRIEMYRKNKIYREKHLEKKKAESLEKMKKQVFGKFSELRYAINKNHFC